MRLTFEMSFFPNYLCIKIIFPLLFFINEPFHTSCQSSSFSSSSSPAPLSTFTQIDFPLSFIRPSQDHYPHSFSGVSSRSCLLSIFPPSVPTPFLFPPLSHLSFLSRSQPPPTTNHLLPLPPFGFPIPSSLPLYLRTTLGSKFTLTL